MTATVVLLLALSLGLAVVYLALTGREDINDADARLRAFLNRDEQ
jgi:hypothetical protein